MSGSSSHGMQESSHHTPPKAADDPKSELARSFLESLPKLPSHSNKLYLETTVQSKSQLVKLFQAYCDSKGVKRASRQVLIRVSKQMNIAIFKPRKDQCNICTSYILGQYSAEQFDCHIRRKEEAQNEKKKDKRMAQDDSSVLVFTMDLQAVLLAPRLFANASYFKTKLCCHNFTLYELTSRRCVRYFWHECNGDVTSNTFASCIMDYIQNSLASHTLSTIIIYSDGCCYQNRNTILSNCLLHIAVEKKTVIIQKYLEKGHTWMEVDSVHSTIERRLRHRQIYWPPEYSEVFTSARSKPHPYIVKNVDFFKDFSNISYYRSIRPGNSAGDPQVVDIRALKYSPDGVISYKLEHTDDWAPLPRRSNRGAAVQITHTAIQTAEINHEVKVGPPPAAEDCDAHGVPWLL